jgi:hypothetical protein
MNKEREAAVVMDVEMRKIERPCDRAIATLARWRVARGDVRWPPPAGHRRGPRGPKARLNRMGVKVRAVPMGKPLELRCKHNLTGALALYRWGQKFLHFGTLEEPSTHPARR